jgi:hypothetical protein
MCESRKAVERSLYEIFSTSYDNYAEYTDVIPSGTTSPYRCSKSKKISILSANSFIVGVSKGAA